MPQIANFISNLPGVKALRESHSSLQAEHEYLEEKIEELEKDNAGWVSMSSMSIETTFSREFLTKIARDAWIYWLKNPLITRAVNTKALYTFGLGVTIEAKHPAVNEVVQEFIDDRANKAALTSHQAFLERERQLQIEGNLLLAIFEDPPTGRCRVRPLPFEEVTDIYSNPEDRYEPWWYKREYQTPKGERKTLWYKDWAYEEKEDDPKPEGLEAKNVAMVADKEVVVYHKSANRPAGSKWGVSEVYAAMDWAKAYKEFLENWNSLVKAYAEFAWQIRGKKPKGFKAAKNKLAAGEQEGPGKIALMAGDAKIDPVKTAGATTSMDDARRLLLMVCAATGLFEHYLGDAKVGNLASTKSMEKPMEIMFRDRQTAWADSIEEIMQYVVDRRAEVGAKDLPKALRGAKVDDKEMWGRPMKVVTLPLDTKNENEDLRAEEVNRTIMTHFPDFMEAGREDRVNATIKAATLDGKTVAGTIPEMKEITRRLLQDLGEADIDEKLDTWFPEEDAESVGGKMPEVPEEGKQATEWAEFRKASATMAFLESKVGELSKLIQEKAKAENANVG